MTPSAHATAAADLLATTWPPFAEAGADKAARLAQVHAVLSTKAGTGSNYAAAETALATAASATGTNTDINRAHALALLAD